MIYNVIKQTESLVNVAHRLVAERVNTNAVVIDATVGNGYDSQFLLDLVKPNGKVYGFDIQQVALDLTRSKLTPSPNADCLCLIPSDHAELAKHIPIEVHGSINAIMFNLGYLPGGNKAITTQVKSTLTALNAALALLAIDGVLTIMAYPGHPAGKLEAEHIEQWCQQLNPIKFQTHGFINSPNNPSAPKLFALYKLA